MNTRLKNHIKREIDSSKLKAHIRIMLSLETDYDEDGDTNGFAITINNEIGYGSAQVVEDKNGNELFNVTSIFGDFECKNITQLENILYDKAFRILNAFDLIKQN